MVSIIIAAYNSRSTIELLLYALNRQTFIDFEVVICDDGGSDNLKELIDNIHVIYPIKYIWQEDKGFRAALARNKAVQMASREILIFLDQDSLPGPKHIELFIENFKKHLYIRGGRQVIDIELVSRITPNVVLNNFNYIKQIAHPHLEPKQNRPHLSNNGCIARELFINIGGFDINYTQIGGEDADLEQRLRVMPKIKQRILANPIVYHLDHPTTGQGASQFAKNRLAQRMRIMKRFQLFKDKDIKEKMGETEWFNF